MRRRIRTIFVPSGSTRAAAARRSCCATCRSFSSISASPDGVSERQLSAIIDDVAHCPAYFQLLVKATLLHGLRELALNAVPAHLVICEKDRIIPAPRFSRHFTKHLPEENHQVTKLDGVGHIPMFEAPERITRVITEFIEQSCPSPGRQRPTG